MKITLLTFSLGLILSTGVNAAGTVCDVKSWRQKTITHPKEKAEHKGKTYGEIYCKKHEASNGHVSYKPTPALDAISPGGNASESLKVPGNPWLLGACTRKCQTDALNAFNRVYAVAVAGEAPPEAVTTSDALVDVQGKVADLNAAAERSQQSAQDIENEIDNSALNQDTLSAIMQELGISGKPEDIGFPKGATSPPRICRDKCLEVYTQYQSRQNAMLDEQEKRIKEIEAERENLKTNANELVTDLNGAFTGDFKKLALYELQQIDPNIKNEEDLANTCSGSVNSTEERAKKIAEVCDRLRAESGELEKLKEKSSKIAQDIDKSKDLDFLLTKIDFEKLKLSEDQKEIAKREIDEATKEKLKGTVLGRMMDQMRDDMCKVAKDPNFMCLDNAFATNNLIDDVGRALNPDLSEKDQKRDNFQNRRIGSSAVTNP